MKTKLLKALLMVFLSVALAGCTFIFQSGRRSDMQRIEELSRQLDELTTAKNRLEDILSTEIGDKQVDLKMMKKGLVITVVGDVLFDSGKAKVRNEAYTILDKVATVLNENVPELNVGIEGHTDNQPIRFSSWKSNWELSTARALSVLHYLVEEKGVVPERISAMGYGEYRPVASNDTREGRQANRRVEIVILPQLTKAKEAEVIREDKGQVKDMGLLETKENLK
ncbi:MAG: OmpA family protein [Candidatus Omnitrophica bacterium]|nr:OmpA family protein [Candidatus Omnitrophota bacterium]MDD5592400.1 OmpA family protein [Candidatus Omnitrophota bacterium]